MKTIVHRKTFEKNINPISFIRFRIAFDRGFSDLGNAILKTAASTKEFTKAIEKLSEVLKTITPWYKKLWFWVLDFFTGEKQYRCHKCRTVMFQCSGWDALAAYECPKCGAWIHTKNGKIYFRSK